VRFGWTLYGEDSRPIATRSGTFPYHREERSSVRGRLLGLCAAKKMIQLCGHYMELTNPTIHLMQHAESTMDHATLNLPQDGYSKFIYPHTDLSTEIQNKDKSPYGMVMPMAMIAALSEPSPVRETSYPPSRGVLYYNEDAPCGCLSKAVIMDHIHRPKLRHYIQHNINIDDTHWDKINWAAHSTSLEESNIERLLPTLKFIHNEWPVGITLEKLYGDIAGCPPLWRRGDNRTFVRRRQCSND
jgi:hypothetical protein